MPSQLDEVKNRVKDLEGDHESLRAHTRTMARLLYCMQHFQLIKPTVSPLSTHSRHYGIVHTVRQASETAAQTTLVVYARGGQKQALGQAFTNYEAEAQARRQARDRALRRAWGRQHGQGKLVSSCSARACARPNSKRLSV